MGGRLNISLRLKIIFSLTALMTLLVVVAEVRELLATRVEREDSLALRTELLTQAQASALAIQVREYDQGAAQIGLRDLLKDPEFVKATVWDELGTEFAQLTNSELAVITPVEERGVVERPIAFAAPSGEVRPIGRVRVEMSRHLLQEKFWADVVGSVAKVAVLLALLITGLLLAILAFTRPIAAMTAMMRRRADGDYSGHVDAAYLKRDDEIGAIARSLEFDQQQRRDEKQLLEISNALVTQLNLDLLLEKIMAAATGLLDAERSTLYLWDPKEEILWSRVAEGLDDFRITLEAGQGIAGTVFQTGETINIEDSYKDPRFNPEIDRLTGFQTRSLLCLPIINRDGDRIGVMQVLNSRDGAFQKRHVERLRSMSAQAAVSIENAQLFESVLEMRNYNEGILKSLSNGVITFDKELKVGKVTDAACRLLEVSAEMVGEILLADMFHGRNDWLAKSVGRVAETGQTDLSLDADVHLDSGEVKSFNLTIAPLHDINDTSIGVMMVLEDLSGEKRVRSTMARYMPKTVVDQLLDGDLAALSGTSQTVTTLFSDIRGFTTHSEKAGARETVRMLNEYFTEMVEVIDDHQGILDKYIGDAVMALFGAPFVNQEDAQNALDTADVMIRRLNELNSRRAERSQASIRIGIGINSGEVVAGNIGSPKRMDYTVIGGPVNLAARLESATETYGAQILLSENTLVLLRRRDLIREVDLIRVKGKQEPVAIHESLGYVDDATSERVRRVTSVQAEAIQAFRAKDFKRGTTLFKESLKIWPEDPLPHVYLERMAQYTLEAPPDDWDGVFSMRTK